MYSLFASRSEHGDAPEELCQPARRSSLLLITCRGSISQEIERSAAREQSAAASFHPVPSVQIIPALHVQVTVWSRLSQNGLPPRGRNKLWCEFGVKA